MVRLKAIVKSVSLAIMALGIGTLLPLSANLVGQEIGWRTDLNGAMQEAATSHRPLLLHFYSNNCVPCKMLDAKAFKDPALCVAMDQKLIPVKINVDNHRQLADRYQVTRWPTDVFLFPNGDELYRTVSHQDPVAYVELLDKVSTRNSSWLTERIAANQAPPPRSRMTDATTRLASSVPQHSIANTSPQFQPASRITDKPSGAPPVVEENPFCIDYAQSEPPSDDQAGPFHLASRSVVAKENRYQSRSGAVPSDTRGQDAAQGKPPVASLTGIHSDDASVDLDGYCPVSLIKRQEWVLGNPDLAVKHRGRIYYFIDEDSQRLFLAQPDFYAPVLSGYDVVHFLQTGELVAGKREYGCRFAVNGQSERVFLFAAPQTRSIFNQEASKYAYSLGEAPATPTQPDSVVANGTSNPTMAR